MDGVCPAPQAHVLYLFLSSLFPSSPFLKLLQNTSEEPEPEAEESVAQAPPRMLAACLGDVCGQA